MKKDKYPLAGGLMSSDPSRPGSVGARDMYSGMNGYMPNGYSYDASSMYGQSPYTTAAASHMSSSPSSIYSRYDMGGMYSSSTASTASAMSSYMNMYGGSPSMYGAGGGSPYSGMGQGPISPGAAAGEPEGCVSHHSHSPGSVKSEAGGSGPPTGSSTVSMGSGSPGSGPPACVPPGPSSGPLPSQVKREPMTSPPVGHYQQNPQQQELNQMISRYLPPGDSAAAAAGDPNAQARIISLQQHMYASSSYGSLMAGAPQHPGMSHSPDPMTHPPPSAYPV
jgi:hypothetical protein